MIKAPVSLQDLRHRLYVKAKAIGPITLDAKCTGARSAGNAHAACDAAGAGDGATASPIRGMKGETTDTAKDDPTGHHASSRPYRSSGRKAQHPTPRTNRA